MTINISPAFLNQMLKEETVNPLKNSNQLNQLIVSLFYQFLSLFFESIMCVYSK